MLPEQQAWSVEKGPGRLEIRDIRVSSELAEYVTWPYLAQVFMIRRAWIRQGRLNQDVRYGITSLPQTNASAQRLLALKRGHWGIENRLHYVKDVTLGEDQSSLHSGAGPHVMATLRNTAVSLLRWAGYHAIAARLRYYSHHPATILALLGLCDP